MSTFGRLSGIPGQLADIIQNRIQMAPMSSVFTQLCGKNCYVRKFRNVVL